MAHGFDVKADDNVFVVLYSTEFCSINIYRQGKESSLRIMAVILK